MASSLSNVVDNPQKDFIQSNVGCDCFLEYDCVKKNLIKYKFLSCKKDYSNNLYEELRKSDSKTHIIFLIMILIDLFCF